MLVIIFFNSHFKCVINPSLLQMTKAKLDDYLTTKHHQLVLQAVGSYHVLPLHPTIILKNENVKSKLSS